MDKKTHWRMVAGKEYLVGEMLNGKDVTMIIKSVGIETLQNAQGKEDRPVIAFSETELKLVVNVTNMKSISKVLESPFIEDWIGKKITLIPVRGRFFGEDQEVIRVKMDYSNIKI